jgi:hypothetical protein
LWFELKWYIDVVFLEELIQLGDDGLLVAVRLDRLGAVYCLPAVLPFFSPAAPGALELLSPDCVPDNCCRLFLCTVSALMVASSRVLRETGSTLPAAPAHAGVALPPSALVADCVGDHLVQL